MTDAELEEVRRTVTEHAGRVGLRTDDLTAWRFAMPPGRVLEILEQLESARRERDEARDLTKSYEVSLAAEQRTSKVADKIAAAASQVLTLITAERDTARADAEQLRSERDDWDSALQATCKAHLAARDEAEQLRAERDAAVNGIAVWLTERALALQSAGMRGEPSVEKNQKLAAGLELLAAVSSIADGTWRTTKGDAGK